MKKLILSLMVLCLPNYILVAANILQTNFVAAAANGDITAVRHMLAFDNVDINFTDDDGNSALSAAIQNRRFNIVRLLLGYTEMRKPEVNDSKTSYLAIILSKLVMLLKKMDSLQIKKALDSIKTMLSAAQEPQLQALGAVQQAFLLKNETFLQSYAKSYANSVAEMFAFKPMLRAILFGEGDASELIGQEADIATPAKWIALTPLHAAVLMNKPDAVNLLLTKKAVISSIDQECALGFNALHLAILLERPEIITALLNAKANPHKLDLLLKVPPIYMAMLTKNANIVELLLEKSTSADINSVDMFGNSALHLAAILRDEQTFELLTGKKADLKLKNEFGQTPTQLKTDITSECNDPKILFLLKFFNLLHIGCKTGVEILAKLKLVFEGKEVRNTFDFPKYFKLLNQKFIDDLAQQFIKTAGLDIQNLGQQVQDILAERETQETQKIINTSKIFAKNLLGKNGPGLFDLTLSGSKLLKTGFSMTGAIGLLKNASDMLPNFGKFGWGSTANMSRKMVSVLNPESSTLVPALEYFDLKISIYTGIGLDKFVELVNNIISTEEVKVYCGLLESAPLKIIATNIPALVSVSAQVPVEISSTITQVSTPQHSLPVPPKPSLTPAKKQVAKVKLPKKESEIVVVTQKPLPKSESATLAQPAPAKKPELGTITAKEKTREVLLNELFDAIGSGDVDAVKASLNLNPDINAVSRDRILSGFTPLHFAIWKSTPKDEIIRALLQAGADPTFVLPDTNGNSYSGYNALQIAVYKNHTDIIDILLNFEPKIKIDLEATIQANSTENGWTALRLAIDKENPEIIEKLLGYGAMFDDNILNSVKDISDEDARKEIEKIFNSPKFNKNRARAKSVPQPTVESEQKQVIKPSPKPVQVMQHNLNLGKISSVVLGQMNSFGYEVLKKVTSWGIWFWDSIPSWRKKE